MDTAGELTNKEGKRLERHLKFAERVQRHRWIPAAGVLSVLLVAAVYAASATAAGIEAARLYREISAAPGDRDFAEVQVLGTQAMTALARAGTSALAAFFFVAMLFMLRESLKDHALIVKLHARAQPAESGPPASASPESAHAG